MSREIKFRVRNLEENKFESLEDIIITFDDKGIEIYTNTGSILENYEINQYTGLQDKNGIDIYEGDIVKYTFDLPGALYATENGLKARTHKVFWSEWRGSFAVGNNLANNDLFRYARNGNRVEVIGNIYENSKLLQQKENSSAPNN